MCCCPVVCQYGWCLCRAVLMGLFPCLIFLHSALYRYVALYSIFSVLDATFWPFQALVHYSWLCYNFWNPFRFYHEHRLPCRPKVYCILRVYELLAFMCVCVPVCVCASGFHVRVCSTVSPCSWICTYLYGICESARVSTVDTGGGP